MKERVQRGDDGAASGRQSDLLKMGMVQECLNKTINNRGLMNMIRCHIPSITDSTLRPATWTKDANASMTERLARWSRAHIVKKMSSTSSCILHLFAR